MRKLLVVGLATAFVGSGILLLAQKKTAGERGGVADVARTAAEFGAAANAGDAAKVALLYADDAALMPPNGEIVRGRSSIEEYWRAAIARGFGGVMTASIASSHSGNLGYETGTYDVTISPPGGTPIHDRGKYMNVMMRGPDGRWRLIYDIWNSSLPAKQ